MEHTPDVALFAAAKPKKRKNAVPAVGAPRKRSTIRDASVENGDNEAVLQVEQAHVLGAAAAVTFQGLGVGDHLEGVCASLGMTRPTPIQEGVIPAILDGRDVIGVAHTGSGKTAAFALPVICKLAKECYGVYATVLTPTRELAFQIAEQFGALGSSTGLRHLTVVGGMDMQTHSLALLKRPHVVVATPGRLADILDNSSDVSRAFARVATLILDEADRLLDPSFEDALRSILQVMPKKRQTLMFTATMTPALDELKDTWLRDAFVYRAYSGLNTVDALREQYLFVPQKVKEVYLAHLLERLAELEVKSAIVFCSTVRGCELLSALLHQLEIPAASLYSSKKQKQRLSALHQFKSRVVPILVATDVAARGLDIPTVDLVVNFDLPVKAEDYVHRVGRTARAGRQGWALTFVSQYDIELVQGIEQSIGHKLTEHKMDEAEVLKDITKVYAARRAAILALQARQAAS